MDDVAGRVAVVTGGSTGIGRGIAGALARAGATVVITARGRDRLDAAVDVTDLDAMREAAAEVDRRFGRVDVLVANAGIGLTGPVADATPSDWDWVIDVNIRGVGNGIQAFLPAIRRGGRGGHIVTTSSMAGLMPVVAGLYSMTKAAVIALSEALHIELLPEGIGVSAYCPGPTHSEIALGTANRPDRYAGTGYPAPDPERAASAKDQPYMSADEAGERVLAGMLAGRMFILTHPEFLPGVVDRHRLIEDSFPREPVDEVRAAAIPFLLSSPVYAPEGRTV